jgi:hypothetical protein
MIKEKFRKILKKELQDLSSITITTNSDGSYQVFGIYRIRFYKERYLVSKNGFDTGEFRQTNSALSWCIADQMGYHETAVDIKYLDKKLSLLNDDVYLRLELAKKSKDDDTKTNILAKLESKIRTKNELESRLKHYIARAKYWHHRGLQNEVKRIRHSGAI